MVCIFHPYCKLFLTCKELHERVCLERVNRSYQLQWNRINNLSYSPILYSLTSECSELESFFAFSILPKVISPFFILDGRMHICGRTLAWSSRFLWTAMALFWRAFSARMAAGFCCSFCGRRCPHVWKLRNLTCIFSPISSDMVGSFVQRNRLSIPFRGGVNVLLYTFTLFLMKSGKFVSPGGQNCAWNRSDAEKKNCRTFVCLWR